MPDPTPDPWAAAVEAFLDAPPCMRTGEHEPLECSQCTAIGLRAALPHLLGAVVGEMPHGCAIKEGKVMVPPDFWAVGADLLAALQQAAARLTDG